MPTSTPTPPRLTPTRPLLDQAALTAELAQNPAPSPQMPISLMLARQALTRI